VKHDHCPSCGHVFAKARSAPDHRRLFGLIAKAYEQWPHNHEFQPTSAEHLRAYLQCRAGHSVSTPVFVDLELFPEDKRDVAVKLVALAVEASIKAALAEGDYAFTRVHGDAIAVFRPKSIAWSSLDQKAFGPIREAIEAEIEAALGVKCDALLRAEAA
jgi:hypothetical protein